MSTGVFLSAFSLMNYRVQHFKTLSSTNDYAIELAKKGAPEGTVVVSDYQTKGRGRGKRKWVSSRGLDLLFTVLVRPPIKAHKAPLLTHMAGECVRKVLHARYPAWHIRLKQPNDVMVSGRKICGILVESSTKNGVLDYAVVGIGLNVNSEISKRIRNSTSIYEIKGKKTSKSRWLEQFLAEFDQKYTNFSQKSA